MTMVKRLLQLDIAKTWRSLLAVQFHNRTQKEFSSDNSWQFSLYTQGGADRFRTCIVTSAHELTTAYMVLRTQDGQRSVIEPEKDQQPAVGEASARAVAEHAEHKLAILIRE